MLHSILTLLHRRAGKILRQGGRISPEKVADEAVTMAVGNCEKIYTDPQWRGFVGLDKMSEAGQDFVLNEVLCAALVAVYAGLDEIIPFLPGDRREFWRQVRDGFYPTFQKWQCESGISNINEWKKLFDLRLKEYEEGQKETYGMFRDKLARLRTDDDRHATVRVMTIAALCISHIARGKDLPSDSGAVRCLQQHLDYLAKENWRRFGW